MNILVICQYYHPEPFRVSDICEELVNKGHRVTVVTGTPNYPMGEIYEGYGKGRKTDEVLNGVTVHRCFTIARKNGSIRRFLNYYSYAISSSRYINKLENDFDVVLVNQLSPVMMAYAGMRYKKKYGKKLVMYCLDLWPESLTAGGIGRGGMVYKLFHKISKSIYKKADKILITSKMFREYFTSEFGIDNDKIEYLPQYAESDFENISSDKKEKENFDFLFAGNIGKFQGIDVILKAVKELKEYKNIKFHIVGDGSALKESEKFAVENGLDSVTFYGRKPLSDMPSYYKMADAMFVTLKKDPILSLTLPGKVQSYLASGKPVMGAIDGETKNLISEAKCGFCAEAEDYMALAENIKKFCALSKEERTVMADNAKKYYEENFKKNVFIEKLIKELEKAC